jgi:hypothetical protein
MGVLFQDANFLLSGISAEGTGSALDTRNAANYAYMVYMASGHSGIFNLEVSHDKTGWMIASTHTATATQTGTAQIAAFYPYVRANVVELYSAAGGTGILYAHYTPGVR